MIAIFNKRFKNDKYELLFNTKTGFEILQGINGNDDPFSLELPSLLDIGVMGTCKHKCPFCYQGHENKPNMPFSEFKKIIDEVSFHVNQVALGGRGDPNHHEEFKEIIEYCRSKNVVPNYTTSGIGLTDEQIEISKMCGAVAVSDYEQSYTYNALGRLIDAGVKTNIHQIFSKQSATKCSGIVFGNIPSVWDFDHSKLNAVIFLLFKPHGAGKDVISEMQPTVEQLKAFAEIVFNSKASFKIGMDSCLINHMIKYGKPSNLQLTSIDTCEAARMSAYITPDMKFMPCSFADQELWSIPLKDKGITEIWNNGENFKTFRWCLENESNKCPLIL